MQKKINSFFTQQLMAWNSKENKRIMPWKGEKDAYKIWLSEIILQQTRVEQGTAYYEKFIKQYPTIIHLAKAKDEEVFKLWEGLGYYSRCKNLLFTARFITENYKGNFPNNYHEILALKGVGVYTAAAIASFAYNLPYAVVDGNVFRVLARFFGINTPIDSTQGKKLFTTLAQNLLDVQEPAKYNQAIMDFGATICKPAMPLCSSCYLQTHCVAYKNNNAHTLPIKEKKLTIKKRYITYIVFNYKNTLLVRQRQEKDIWQNLYEFYALSNNYNKHVNQDEVNIHLQNLKLKDYSITAVTEKIKQQLTHQTIIAQFFIVHIKHKPLTLATYQWVNKTALSNIAFPKLINSFLQSNSVFY